MQKLYNKKVDKIRKLVVCIIVMDRPLKCSKLSDTKGEKSVDRISSLPDDLLSYMLSFLPTKGAVATSVLSSRWRCLHMLTNSLLFEAHYVPSYLENYKKAQKKSFKKFVYRVLLNHKVSPVKKFHLHCEGHVYDDSHLHAWVSAALSKGVEQIHLCLNGHINALPRRLFNCQTIVDMQISYIEGFQLPESINLPSLKILYLSGLKFSDRDAIAKLISACSLLQELTIDTCVWPADSNHRVSFSSRVLTSLTIIFCEDCFEVDGPNLSYFEYFSAEGVDVALSLKNTERLITACLEFSFVSKSDSIQHALALIKAVHHVKDLQLVGEVIQYLTCSRDDHIPSFPNMVKLTVGYCFYDTWKYVIYWLANSPRLETVIFQQSLINLFEDEEWPSNVTLDSFLSTVKVIEADDFRGYKAELFLVKHLLGNAKALKKLILYKHLEEMTKEKELQASKKLLMLPRASTTCVVHLEEQSC